jgi:hypothetical protein
MGRMVEMDDRMDEKGYLRFCTREQTVRLMGNAISEEVAELAKQSGLDVQAAQGMKKRSGLMGRLMTVRWIRFIVQGLVNRLYRWLNG